MTRILSSDLLIADAITPFSGNAALEKLAFAHGLKPGGKWAINREQFETFFQAVAGHEVTWMPGGSSANTLVTLKKLLGADVEIDFLGLLGDDDGARMIKTSLSEAGIALWPKTYPKAPRVETAISYVMTYPDGQRTIATYPGNARDILRPEMITDALVESCDVVFLQGSLWKKFGADFAGRLLTLTERHKKKLWLALPTYAKYVGDVPDGYEAALAYAELILGNEEELTRIYHRDAKEALTCLQQTLTPKHTAFITCADRGAVLVTAQSIETIAPVLLPANAIINTLGAGDTAFAGFIAGHLNKLPLEACARLAMQLAAEKLRIHAARLPDPKAALKNAATDWKF